MKTLILLLALSATRFTLTEPATFTPTDAVLVDGVECPTQPGAYLAIAGGWKKMEEVHSLEIVRTGLRVSALTYGLRPTRTKAVFPDSSAPVKISAADAVFCIVDLADQARDLLMVKLEPAAGKREVEIGTGAEWASQHGGIAEKDRVRFEARQMGDRTFLLQAPLDLHSGEYSLFPRDQLAARSHTFTAFDFSIGANFLWRMRLER